MKRTLALFLTLCMALSMFSFPAFAAEADVAVLDEAALVETETTPAPTEDVVAPVAAGLTAVTPVAAPVKQEYDAKSVVVDGKTVGAITIDTLTVDKDFTVAPAEGAATTFRDAETVFSTWTVTLTNPAYTFGKADEARVATTTVDIPVEITPVDVSALTATVTLTRTKAGETPKMEVTAVGYSTNADVAAEILAFVKALPASAFSFTMGKDHELITCTGDDLSPLKDKTGDFTGEVTFEKQRNWTATDNKATFKGTLAAGEAVEGTVTADWASSYKYAADALKGAALQKGVAMGDGSKPTTSDLYLMTAEAKAEIDKENEKEADRIAAYKSTGTKLADGDVDAFAGKDAGDYVIFIDAASATMKGTALKNIKVEGYTAAEVSAMMSSKEDGKVFTLDNPGSPKLTITKPDGAGVKIEADDLQTTYATTDSQGKVEDPKTAPTVEGGYKVTYTTKEVKSAAGVVNVAAGSKSFTYSIKKMGFAFQNVVEGKDYNGSGSTSIKSYADTTVQALTVTNGAGDSVAYNTAWTYKLDSYVKPDGSLSTDGSENYEQVPGTWVVNFTLKGKDTYADKFVETKGTVTVTVGNKTATGALSFEYAGKDLALTNLEHNYDGKDWGETAAKVFDPANMTVKYDNNAITDYSLYTAELFYNSNAADAKDVKVGDQATGYTVKDAGTYTLVVTYDPQEPNTDPVVDKTQTFTVAPYDLKTLKLVNLSMEYADPAPKAPAVDVDKNVFVADLQGTDTKADLDLTFAWTDNYEDVDTSKAGNVEGVTATIGNTNYTVSNGATFTGDMKVTGKMNSAIELTGDTEITYDGKLHELEATLTGAITGDADAMKTAQVVINYTQNGKVAPVKNVGTYLATAKLLQGGNYAAQDATMTITVKPVTPTLEFNNLTDKTTVPYDEKGHFGTLTKGNVTITGITGENLENDFLNLYWADANGNQLYSGKDKDKNDIVSSDKSVFEGNPTEVSLTNGPVLPGDYYLTAQYVTSDEKNVPTADQKAYNYTDSAVISQKFTIETAKTDLSQIAPYATAIQDVGGNNVLYDLHYGDVLEGAKLFTLAETGSKTTGMLTGTYVVTGASSEKANKVGNQQFTVKFIPDKKGYGEVVLPVKATVGVKKAVFEKDVQFKINNTEVAFDGKDHYLGEAEGAGAAVLTDGMAFAADASKVKFSYAASELALDAKEWSADASALKFNTKGGHPVWVRVECENYETKAFMGKVTIGVVSATLKVEDTTKTYTNDDKKPDMEVKLVDKDGKVLATLPASEYTLQFHAATDRPNDMAFKPVASNKLLHAAKDAYWVEVSMNNTEYKGYSVTSNKATARYTVNKATLADANLSELVTKTELSTTFEYDGTTKLNTKLDDLTAIVKANPEKKDEVVGTWEWKDGDKTVLEVAKNYPLEYVLSNKDTAVGAVASDYEPLTKEITVKGVTPAELTVTGTVEVDPKEAPYGITVGDLVLTTSKDFTAKFSSKEIPGKVAFNDPADTVLKIGENTLDLVYVPTEGNPANFKLPKAQSTVVVMVVKADPELVIKTASKAYDGKPAAVEVSTNSESRITLTWYDDAGRMLPTAPTEIGNYFVEASVDATENFNAKTVRAPFEITYNQTGIEGFVYRLYSVALGREPEQEGYTKWVNGMKSKEYTPEFVSYGFIFSKEFTNKKYDNATFLKIMYSTFMDREPDASGYNMWLNGLNSGEFSREDVFQGFVKSREFTNICARYGL